MGSSGGRARQIVFYLVPNFSMIAFATAMEPLRLANRLLARKAYEWRLISTDGISEKASNGTEIKVNGSLADESRRLYDSDDRPDMIFVCSGIHVEKVDTRALRQWIRRVHNAGISVGGLCTGAWVLADAGLLDGRRCAIHWENMAGFSETYPEANVFADLFEVDDTIYTCAGGTAALDMMFHIIREDHDDVLVNRICEQCLIDRVRSPHDRQRLPLRARLGVQNSKLLFMIELMEANISEPLSLVEISDYVGLSRRQIERLFRQNLGLSPARYYLEIRLDRARHLLMQSTIPIVEVAIACGFVSASHFSKCFREMFGRTPQAVRMEREFLNVE